MAERRMFAKTIIDSDAFLDMPLTTQALYFHLSMRADDEGFINNPKKIMRMIGASDDEFRLLQAKSFIIPFESGVCVIKHWRIHNYLRNDRFKPTVYVEEKAQLSVKDNRAYTLNPGTGNLGIPVGIPNADQCETQYRLGKVSVVEDSIEEYREDEEDILPEAKIASGRKPKEIIPSEPAVIALTLNDKSQFPVTETDIRNWQELYPAVNILQELRNMKGWLDANPAKRKTKAGIRRFINGWLSREQDKYHPDAVVPIRNTSQGQTGNSGVDRLLAQITGGAFDE